MVKIGSAISNWSNATFKFLSRKMTVFWDVATSTVLEIYALTMEAVSTSKAKAKQSRYTPWWRLGVEEV
jgi:hypothetical protein